MTSESDINPDCVITFQTDSILQKFMIRFEKLALDCNDHLIIFDGGHAIGKSKVCSKFLEKIGSNIRVGYDSDQRVFFPQNRWTCPAEVPWRMSEPFSLRVTM